MAIDNTATFIETVSGTSHSSSLTLGSGTGRKIIVVALTDSNASTFTATFDGNAMTAITGGAATNPGDSAIKVFSFFYDVADGYATGSKTIVVSTGSFSTADITWHAWQLSGASSGQPEYAAVTTTDNTVTATTDSAVSASSGACVLAAIISGSATPTFTWSGGTVTERTENNETNYTTCSADAAGVSAGTKTVTATASVSSGFKNLIVVSIAAAASGGLTISSVTPSTFDDGKTGIVIAGSGFGATQGSSTLTIGSQAQTVTAWSDTSITFTSERGSNSMGAASLKLTRG